jgi:rhodanese-related sulfurtransferase
MPTDTNGSSIVTRRGFGLFAGVALIGGGFFAANWFNVTARADGDKRLSVSDAHAATAEGRIVLVDIRRPDEWARTGIGEGAVALDMRRPDFVAALTAHVDGQKTAPIALICARGVRSARLSARLTQAGFTNIIDVPEGMLGSGAGPGWLKSGLPTTPFKG